MFFKKNQSEMSTKKSYPIDLSIEVKLLGTSDWCDEIGVATGDIVRFRIHVVNESNSTFKNLILRDILPEGLAYIYGTTSLINTANQRGVSLSDSLATEMGLNIGDYSPRSGAWLYFNAAIEADDPIVLRNIVQATTGPQTGVVEQYVDIFVEDLR